MSRYYNLVWDHISPGLWVIQGPDFSPAATISREADIDEKNPYPVHVGWVMFPRVYNLGTYATLLEAQEACELELCRRLRIVEDYLKGLHKTVGKAHASSNRA